MVDQSRPSYRLFKKQILHDVNKLQKSGKCLIFPRSLLMGTAGLHVSPIHVVVKPGDDKIRITVDASASGLNSGTNMQEVTELLGQFSNPNLQSVAEMLNIAGHSGDSFLFKTDVSGAFSTMKLSPEAALSQSIQFGDYILIPLVSLFGWSATPAYYNIVSKAIDWAQNGGVSVSIFSGWCMQQNVEIIPSIQSQSMAVTKSLTYVDDTFGPCSLETAAKVMSDVFVIIRQLLGPDSVNNKKTEGPSSELQLIGWRCDMVSRTMSPSVNGIKKMIWWLFRGVRVENGELKNFFS